MRVKVFLSWSGAASHAAAEAFRNWLPNVLQITDPFFSPDDIEKGAQWFAKLLKELTETGIGIFFLTPENLRSTWMALEAGACSIHQGNNRVCPIYLGLTQTEVPPPFSIFQCTGLTKKDFKLLISRINVLAGPDALSDQVLNTVFERWWPDLEQELSKVPSIEESEARSVDSIVRETLEIVRGLQVYEDSERYSWIKSVSDNMGHFYTLSNNVREALGDDPRFDEEFKSIGDWIESSFNSLIYRN